MPVRMLCLIAACVSMLAASAQCRDHLFEPEKISTDYPMRRNLHYSLTLENLSSETATGVDFWVHAPVRKTPSQKCLTVVSSEPADLIADEFGDQVLHFNFPSIPPFGTKIIQIRAEMALNETPWAAELPKKDLFLTSEPMIESGNPEIIKAALELSAKSEPETAKALSKWVSASIAYSGYAEKDRGALYALRNRKGDCTEYATLFVALCRALKIPARVVSGYVYAEDSIVEPENFHNWAEVYLDGGWVTVDPQKKIFNGRSSDFIAFSLAPFGNENSPLKGEHRFWCSEKDIKIKFN